MSKLGVKNLQFWTERWLRTYNHSNGYTDATYDFQLDEEVSGWSDNQKMEFLLLLSKEELCDDAIAFLGAGLAEELLLKDVGMIEQLESEVTANDRLAEIVAHAWEHDEMSDLARLLIRGSQDK